MVASHHSEDSHQQFWIRSYKGVKHIKCSTYHPSSNGLAECLVRTFKQAMKAEEAITVLLWFAPALTYYSLLVLNVSFNNKLIKNIMINTQRLKFWTRILGGMIQLIRTFNYWFEFQSPICQTSSRNVPILYFVILDLFHSYHDEMSA